jgi:hypothetical protein
MRRGRVAPWMRAMLAEHRLHPSDFIWPVFICDGSGDHSADQKEGAGRGANHPPGFVDVLPAHRLADEDRRRHAEAEDERDQKEHDDIGV